MLRPSRGDKHRDWPAHPHTVHICAPCGTLLSTQADDASLSSEDEEQPISGYESALLADAVKSVTIGMQCPDGFVEECPARSEHCAGCTRQSVLWCV